MPINITMPALSPTMEEGNLAKWLVKEGDTVSAGDVIAEIETDKATMEVEAVDEGTVQKLVVPAGTEGVKVNAVIAILAAEGEDTSAAPAAEEPKAEAQKPAEKAAEPAPKAEAAAPPAPKADGARMFASPLARRIAKEKGIDLTGVTGSGPHGRIVLADVEGAKAQDAKPAGATRAEAPAQAQPAPAAQAPAPKPASDDAVRKLFAEGSFETVPHDTMRKTIARRLVEAKSTIPHFYLSADCQIDALLALRKQLNDAAPTRKGEKGEEPTYKLSVNDLVIKALALALRDVPDANVSWTESAMLRHKHADVGVAVSIPGGLITPIVRRAEEKSLSAISNEMKDLAARARARKLKPEEFQGGTSAVSNLGMFGVKNFSAVINPPHATILAVGAGEERAVVKDGQVVVANVMSVTLSTDHRAVDGALGAELLAAFRTYIEKPMSLLV
ncbi:MAG: pyruvate dehydrogenase complex dihydrolipoamide acetyltransferase [Mesorhizobium amorphae]|nr:MAG: pyruvate dehydrogenase complex dihydrolipoamide acetyltransferase [Mesorhizobium amorphae]